MARLTRQEMKRDEVMESLGSVIDYVREKPKVVFAVVAVLVVAGLGVLGFIRYQAHRTAQANDALAQAIDILHAPVGADAKGDPHFATEAERDQKAKDALTGLIDSYGSTGAAESARLLLAAQVASEGDVDRAVGLWKQVEGSGRGAVAAEAELNLINELRGAGKNEEVESMLRGEMDNSTGALPPDAVIGELSETLRKLGKDAEAERLEQKLTDNYPDSPYAAALQQANGGTPVPMPNPGAGS